MTTFNKQQHELHSANESFSLVEKNIQFANKTPGFASSLPSVLLIEDNQIALSVIESILTETGCRFTSMQNGKEALGLAQAFNFDLILTDIGLPGFSGIEFTRNLRQWEQTHHKKRVPVVGLTAHALDKAEQECFQAGMDKVLPKPPGLKAIKALIEKFGLNDKYDPLKPQASNNQHKVQGELGRDLPDKEEELFKIKQFPLLDTESGIATLGSDAVLKTMLQIMVESSFIEDEAALKEGFAANNWLLVEKLAHRLKSSALYCGTVRLRYACQYLERYHKAGHTTLLNKLYQQLLDVLEETKQTLISWLDNQHANQ